ncbi:MAG: hypothetical protein ACRENU_01060 [Gemmatimonadaceae bacterium]
MRSNGLKLVAAAMLVSSVASAQAQQADASRKVEGGGIFVQGWMGTADAGGDSRGLTINDGKFASMGPGIHITTGPAATYWNPANKASGDYTVKATFSEAKYMSLNDHPHPYGIMIGGNDLGTDQQSYLYCAAYGSGTFIVRGYGPPAAGGAAVPFQVNGRRGEANAAVNKAAGKDQPVKQEIAMSVKGDKVECAINGTVVGSYNKADVVGAGKAKSTDGVWGIRIGHNADVHVTGPTMSKP